MVQMAFDILKRPVGFSTREFGSGRPRKSGGLWFTRTSQDVSVEDARTSQAWTTDDEVFTIFPHVRIMDH